MKKGNFVGDMLKLMMLAIVIIMLVSLYYNNTAAFHLPKSDYTKAEEKKQRLVANTLKRQTLEKSFAEMMDAGDGHMNSAAYVAAAQRYFDAKSIYPERFEPRIALCRSLFKLAQNADYYLPAAQKEIHYAFKYSHNTDDQILLDELCQMDTDVIEIYDQARDRFKYWEELMTLEDY